MRNRNHENRSQRQMARWKFTGRSLVRHSRYPLFRWWCRADNVGVSTLSVSALKPARRERWPGPEQHGWWASESLAVATSWRTDPTPETRDATEARNAKWRERSADSDPSGTPGSGDSAAAVLV